MLVTSPQEGFLLTELFDHPRRFSNRWDSAANCNLRQILFRSLAKQRDDYLHLFFPEGLPTDRSKPWSLREAQGAIEGAEYTAAAKGTACGHIFKVGESTYHCKTCAADDTCVLCARCFEASDHEGHAVFISVSPGNSGCCDCGDAEAWRRKVDCTIHTADTGQRGEDRHSPKDKSPVGIVGRELPVDLVEAIRTTIARATDYLCDVFSCSPEQLRLPKTVTNIREDERKSRLSGLYAAHARESEADDEIEYALILWNDEKHTVDEVQNQVARACKRSKRFGHMKAMEVNDTGRSIIHYSTDVSQLLVMAEIIEQLRVTVTIRSSRDTFREEMCASIIDWISDIAGCSVGSDPHILRHVVCEEFLKPWRTGSSASNKQIGAEGLDDHEFEDNEKNQERYRWMMRPLQPAANVVRVTLDLGTGTRNVDNDANDDDEDGEDEDADQMNEDEDEEMDDAQSLTNATLTAVDAEMEVDFMENDDMTEALEATIAGYPPPPLPPGSGRGQRNFTPSESEDGDLEQSRPVTNEPYSNVPRTPKARSVQQTRRRPGKHWLEKPDGFNNPRPMEPCEDLWQRVRLDFLILYDLRLWKILRINLRHLYITTVITLPHFKRILGLRFAGLYTALAQLYLIADREPDHSIINLSIQMLTTPTITQEVVERGNFLTNLMAILYTFLTTRQVGFPEDVNPTATLAFDAGAVANRRLFHFFLDLRWLFQSDFVHYRLREEPHYLLQFLDLVKLHQGACPNVRATSEHVEYESDAWISASMILKEINKLCKQAAVAYEPSSEHDEDKMCLRRAIRTVGQVIMVNSLGCERKRFVGAELKDDLQWHVVGPFGQLAATYRVPEHVVQSEPMSFHHPLHYLLSWLLENAKTTDRDEMRALLCCSTDELKQSWNVGRTPLALGDVTSPDLLCSIFEQPLRVCAWLAQMKAGMWVRNGITLRHQAHTYRSVSYRDVGYQRDILMIQAGLVLCGSERDQPGELFLAQMIDRFQMTAWFRGDWKVVAGFEESQQIDVLEDFFHLLTIALCERGNLVPIKDRKEQHIRALQHDIAHVLCFKPLSFSELSLRLTEKVDESDDFSEVLQNMTNYRAPEGLSDTGTFELKQDFIGLVDPYYAHYSRNQREEGEGIYKKYMARKTGKLADDVVYEPTLQPIPSGLFANISAFISTPLFHHTVLTALTYVTLFKNEPSTLQVTRIETFLHMILHLTLLATNDDRHGPEFVKRAVVPLDKNTGGRGFVELLIHLISQQEYASCHPTIKHILRKMQLHQPEKLTSYIGVLGAALDRGDSGSPASLSQDDKERKKQEALARQAKVMAQMKQQQTSFLQNQGLSSFGDELDDFDDMSVTDDLENIEHKKTWNFPAGTCIWCQEETDDQRLYGTFAYLAESSIIRTTSMTDPDRLNEVVETPISLDRPADDIRPFGVAGDNKRIVQKVGPGGTVIETERQGLSKGFHSEQDIRGSIATTCGHIMHYSCFELYMQHSQRRHQQQIARNHPENTKLNEFTCPLCKALGNTFLPIIWKAKECAQEHELHAAHNFEDWLLESSKTYAADLTHLKVGPSTIYRPQQAQALSNRSSHYISTNFAPSLVAAMNDLSIQASPSLVQAQAQSPHPRSPLRRSSELIRTLFGRGDGNQGAADLPLSSPVPEQLPRMAELLKAYARVEETMNVNLAEEDETINPISTLSRTLGLSISAFEIAHRGVSSNPLATSLIAEMPEQALTHFRILSETIESYLAVNVVRSTLINPVAREAEERREVLTALLFGTRDGTDDREMMEITGRTLFQDDIFMFFNDWLSFMAPSVAEASSILQLCFWAEVVKAMFVCSPRVMDGNSQGTSVIGDTDWFSYAARATGTDDREPSTRGPFGTAEGQALRRLVDRYAQAFLRKAIVVMYVRYGLDFECPYDIDPEAPELDRLTRLLHLAPIDEMAKLRVSGSTAGRMLSALSRRWSEQAAAVVYSSDQMPSLKICMPHPAIFELVGLPKTYDTLTEEAIRRRCPTTGKEISDPAICLFCGDIFCSQAICCMTDKNKGGCYKHMAKCGGKVGMFINVRKCMVLFLHGAGNGSVNGSFTQAPYLDKHGEPDPTLRRHHQLFLNQRRYDKLLREVWLQHGIPTVISRKLEADNNPGGWETL